MKKTHLLTLLVVTSLLACTKIENISVGDVFEARTNRADIISNITISLDYVEDSRCPDDVACNSLDGQALAKITFEKNSEKITKSLKLGEGPLPKADTIVVFDKKVILLSILPYPNTREPVPQRNYKVQLKLE
jgi:hypothetical protein